MAWNWVKGESAVFEVPGRSHQARQYKEQILAKVSEFYLLIYILTFGSAAQAWNRNDARAAKALSLRGQAENEAMRKAHREAAKALYEERNKHLSTRPIDDDDELYVDLHGLHPEEAIEYLEEILLDHEKKGRRIIYAITGTGHHSKNGKDKVGKGVRTWLNECGYMFREFSVPGERGGYIGGVLGIDITVHRRQPVGESQVRDEAQTREIPVLGGKIHVLKRDEVPAWDEWW
jgi:DNA-nicking Smr family endonuclease